MTDPPPALVALCAVLVLASVRAQVGRYHASARSFESLATAYRSARQMCPPTGFARWVRFAKRHQCSLQEIDYDRIYADLQRFRDRHAACVTQQQCGVTDAVISAADLRKAAAMPSTKAIRIVQGRLEPASSQVSIISSFAKDLPDLMLVVNALDQPRVPLESGAGGLRPGQCNLSRTNESAMSHGLFHTPEVFAQSDDLVPLFSQSTISSCFGDILFPSSYYVRNSVGSDPGDPWHVKQPVVFWRGSSSGGLARADSNFVRFHRQRLVEASRNLSSFASSLGLQLDVGFTSFLQCEPKACSRQQAMYGTVPRVPDSSMGTFKFLLDIDGNSFSQRLLTFVRHSGSLVIRASVFECWVLDRLRPWVHYVPLRLDMSNLRPTLQWLATNDDEARRIARRANAYAARWLRQQDMACYWFRLLLEYARLTEAPPMRELKTPQCAG